MILGASPTILHPRLLHQKGQTEKLFCACLSHSARVHILLYVLQHLYMPIYLTYAIASISMKFSCYMAYEVKTWSLLQMINYMISLCSVALLLILGTSFHFLVQPLFHVTP